MEISRPEYWSGYPSPSACGLPNPRGNPGYPELQVDLLPAELQGKSKNPRVFILSHLQQIFPGQDSHKGILHCRRILYQLSYQGSPSVPFSSVLSHVRLFVTPWTAAQQASLSSTNTQSLLKLMSIKLLMSCNYLILCCPLLLLPSIFPASGSFPMSQFFASGGQSIGASASASVLPMNIQD